jgi:hypothetical protein
MSDTTKIPEENKELNEAKPTVAEEKQQLSEQDLDQVAGGVGDLQNHHSRDIKNGLLQ